MTASEAHSEEIWLHRYFPLKYLDKVLNADGSVNVRFSRLDTFTDQREGWHPILYRSRDAFVQAAEWLQFGLASGYRFEGFAQIFDIFSELNDVKKEWSTPHSDENMVRTMSSQRRVKLIQDIDRSILSTYISCWFKSTLQVADNARYMWDLYAHQERQKKLNSSEAKEYSYEEFCRRGAGVRLSIPMNDLKKVTRGILIQSADVDYSGTNTSLQEGWKCKDPSYQHEREYRFFTHLLNHGKKQWVTRVSPDRILIQVWNGYEKDVVKRKLVADGFYPQSYPTTSGKYFNVSPMLPELHTPPLNKLFKEIYSLSKSSQHKL